jgi:hypothetical protein
MDQQQMERCLEQVVAYRASGQTAKVWAEANDVPMRAIASWCAHISTVPAPAPRSNGFVSARVAPSAASASVRVALTAGTARLELNWPLAHTRELAALLREFSR